MDEDGRKKMTRKEMVRKQLSCGDCDTETTPRLSVICNQFCEDDGGTDPRLLNYV